MTNNFDIETNKQHRLSDYYNTKKEGINNFLSYARAVIKIDQENAAKEIEIERSRRWK